MTQTAATLLVTVVEDHELIAQSLSFALRSAGIDTVIPQLGQPGDVLDQIRGDRPDVVLLDLQLGGHIGDGEALIPALVEAGVPVIIVTSVTDRFRLAAAVEAGAVGILGKSERFEVLVDAVRRAAAGEHLVPVAQRQQMLMDLRRHRAQEWTRTSMFQRLTHREQQVLGALCEGLAVDVIAEQWCISVATVRSQVRAVLTKLNVNSQLTAVALVRKSGWTPPQ